VHPWVAESIGLSSSSRIDDEGRDAKGAVALGMERDRGGGMRKGGDVLETDSQVCSSVHAQQSGKVDRGKEQKDEANSNFLSVTAGSRIESDNHRKSLTFADVNALKQQLRDEAKVL
jgi:hypothetical protein